MDDTTARLRMVDEQIAARGIRDERVLGAMREIPRHLFLPENRRAAAYDDGPVPIGDRQTISQPYMVAAMTAALAPQPTDRVLEIGTGSGYQTAVLARLSAAVLSIERHASLAAAAAERLRQFGFDHVRVVVGDGTEGRPSEAPFDRILVTAGGPHVPETLQAQLADGGRLVMPVGSAGLQHLAIVDRRGERFEVRHGEACVFVPLIGRLGWPDGGVNL
jgi:protein-L-isoaspartate(D-aspartate) O-methyltransferase